MGLQANVHGQHLSEEAEERSPHPALSAQDTLPLLTIKVRVPPLPVNMIERPHLTCLLNKGICQHKLTLLLAPAGFGKTTLLSSWRVATPHTSMSSAWISLDERDNDPKHFLAYLLFALQGMQFIEELQQFFPPSPSTPLAEEILIRLLNVINATIDRDFVLILDDYHCITNPAIHRALRFLLQYSSQSMHFVIASRVQPPFSLTKLRARGQLWELNSQDLRFDAQETAGFLNETMGLELGQNEIEELSQHIEGWITGLQLVAYTLQVHKRAGTLRKTRTKNRRYLLDYLTTEVFHQQSPELQNLLLQTSILERFNVALCTAVAGYSDEQAAFALLEQANLFLIPVDEEEGWYRYNRLFRDFLSQMFVSQQPEHISTLHRRASTWFEQQGDFPSAIEHALAARDFPRTIGFLLQIIPSLLDQCQVALLLKWLFALPDELILKHPMLGLVYAWALVFSGITTNVEAYLYKVRLPQLVEEKSVQPAANTASWQTLLAVIRSYLANCRGDIQQALEASHYALERLSQVDRHMRTLAILGAGSAFWLNGQEEAAIPLFEQAYAENVAAGALPIAFTTAWALSKIYVTQGYLHKALHCLQLALDHVKREGALDDPNVHPSTGMLYVGIGDIFRRWQNVELASRYLLNGLELCRRWEATGIGGMGLIDGGISLARLRLLQGQKDEALECITLAEFAVQRYNLHFYMPLLLQLFKKGQRAENVSHLTQFVLKTVPRTSYLYELDQLLEVQFALDAGDFERALELLSPLLEQVNTTERLISAVEISLFQALAYYGKGHALHAMQLLSKALADGSQEYHIWLFVEKGRSLAALLEQTLETQRRGNGIGLVDFPLDFATSILSAFETAGYSQRAPIAAPVSPEVRSLVEPLSTRELDVLHLAVEGYTDQEIAQQLSLALCTIKWHIKNIYGKLQVHNRVQLTRQAQKLGLLAVK